MTRQPLASVMVPTWTRHELLIERALPSLCAQTETDWEGIVVSDGPDPELEGLVAALGDPRLRVLTTRRPSYPKDPRALWQSAPAHAVNAGLAVARGEWVTVLADDDELLPDHLETLIGAAGRLGADFVYGGSEIMRGGVLAGVHSVHPPGHGAFCHGAALYRRALGYQMDPASWKLDEPSDWNLWRRMLADGVVMHHVRTPVYRYYLEGA